MLIMLIYVLIQVRSPNRAEVFNPVPGDPLSEEFSNNPNNKTPEVANQAPQDCLKIQAGVLKPVGNTFSRRVGPQEQG